MCIFVVKCNSGFFIYDGIEFGGECVCLEIEEELVLIKSKGGNIKKISIVGYLLGGFVVRYVIGLFYVWGVLDDFECKVWWLVILIDVIDLMLIWFLEFYSFCEFFFGSMSFFVRLVR